MFAGGMFQEECANESLDKLINKRGKVIQYMLLTRQGTTRTAHE